MAPKMIALAIALGAGAGAGDDNPQSPLSKDQKWQRMTAIGDAVATIRSSDPGEMPPQCGHLARAHCWRRIARVADGHRS